MSEILTIPESRRLLDLEKTIERGKQTFVEVGAALAEIRDSKLYRIEHGTFEEYCREKWGWTKQHAYRLIDCATVVESIPSNTRVTSVRQAQELSKVEPAKRAEVVEKAQAVAQAEKRPMTARDIRETAKSAWEQGSSTMPTPEPHAPEDDESDNLWNLKRIWRKANKKEKAEFLKWVQEPGKKQQQ